MIIMHYTADFLYREITYCLGVITHERTDETAAVQDFVLDNFGLVGGVAAEFPNTWQPAIISGLMGKDLFDVAKSIWVLRSGKATRIYKYSEACSGNITIGPGDEDDPYGMSFQRSDSTLEYEESVWEANICFDTDFLSWWEQLLNSTQQIHELLKSKAPGHKIYDVLGNEPLMTNIIGYISEFCRFNEILEVFMAKFSKLENEGQSSIETSVELLATIIPVIGDVSIESGTSSPSKSVAFDESVLSKFQIYGFDFISKRRNGDEVNIRSESLALSDPVLIRKNQYYLG